MNRLISDEKRTALLVRLDPAHLFSVCAASSGLSSTSRVAGLSSSGSFD
ncbi:MAG TPA: hypothetical protein VGC91_15390 [Pyrinomonadaceae bacterium]